MISPSKLKNNCFLSCFDMSKQEILYILELAKKLKNKDLNINRKGKVLGLIFDKSSTRTRVSFQVAMARLGGTTIDLNPNTSQIGRGEPIKDTARVLSRYCDVLAIRTFKQSDLEEYAKWSSKPVINALTDLEHPCQALADYMTIKEEFNDFNNVVLTFIGDGNNPRRSVSYATAQAIDKEVRDLVDDAHETALNILRNNLPLLESISFFSFRFSSPIDDQTSV